MPSPFVSLPRGLSVTSTFAEGPKGELRAVSHNREFYVIVPA
jgi:hypothetical protein